MVIPLTRNFAIAICFPTFSQVVSQSFVCVLCDDFIRAVKEDSKDCTGRLLARPIAHIKLCYFGLNIDPTADNQSTDLGQNASLKVWRLTPVGIRPTRLGRHEFTHQPCFSRQGADTSDHEIAATTVQILPYTFSRIRDDLRHSMGQ